jgi:hypothetical protein
MMADCCVMLSVIYAVLLKALYAECHYAECRYDECRGASMKANGT